MLLKGGAGPRRVEAAEVRRALACVAAMEEEAARFYANLANVVRVAELSAALLFLSGECRNAARLLEALYGRAEGDCSSELGQAGLEVLQRLRELNDRLERGWTPGPARVAELLEEMSSEDRVAGKEVYCQMAAAVASAYVAGVGRALLMAVAERERSYLRVLRRIAAELREIAGEAAGPAPLPRAAGAALEAVAATRSPLPP